MAGVLERPHGLPRTAAPAVQIAGNFAPVGERPPARELPVSGRIPPFINGVYARNGANRATSPPPSTTSSTVMAWCMGTPELVPQCGLLWALDGWYCTNKTPTDQPPEAASKRSS